MRDRRAVVAAAALVVVVSTLPMAVAAFGAVSANAVSVDDTVTGSPSGTIDTAPGDTVTVQVWANATAVRGYQTNFTFNPNIVTVDSVSGSDDFETPVANVNNDGGWVAFNQLRSDETDDPVLAEITLTVSEDATDSTQLTFVESDTKLSDGDGETTSPESFNSVELAIEDDSPTPTPTTTPTPTPTPTPTTTSTPEDTETDDRSNEDSNNSDNNNIDSSNDDSGDTDDNDNSGGSSFSGGGGGAIAPAKPSFSIIETSLNRTSVLPGDPVAVSGTVENDGDEDGTFEGTVYSNGTSMGANTTVEIPNQKERMVNFTVRFDLPGTYAVSLNSTAVGNVTVRGATAANATANATGNMTTNVTGKTTANVTTNATVTPTQELTDTATPTTTEISTQTATPAGKTTDSGSEEVPESGIQTATTDESGPGFGAATVAVSLSLLLGWLGYRRPDE